MKIVSFGGGVQSTALAILAATGKIEVVVFYSNYHTKPPAIN